MGINSAAFIIQPKIIASLLFFPFLVIISMGIGMFGGFLAATLGGIIQQNFFKDLYIGLNLITYFMLL